MFLGLWEKRALQVQGKEGVIHGLKQTPRAASCGGESAHSGIWTDWVRPLALPSQLCKRHLPVSQLPHYNDEEQDLPYMLTVIIKGDNV